MILGFLKSYNVGNSRVKTDFENKIKEGIKLHTIREDSKNRWKKGMKIHFATGTRSNRYNNFKMGVCISTQKIEIKDDCVFVEYDNEMRQIFGPELLYLANNDGFETVKDFWDWFNKYQPFTGKLIHWTDLKY